MANDLDRVIEQNSHDDAGWILDAIRAAEEMESSFGDSNVLRKAAHRLAKMAKAQGCTQVVGASRLGERLAAAAAAVADNGLALGIRAGHAEAVLVVDGVLVTGVQLSRTVRDMRERGASKIKPVAVLSVPGASDIVPPELAGLEILGP